MTPQTIRRPRGGYLILAPMLLVSCGAAPVGAAAFVVLGWYLVWVALLYAIALGLRVADEWIERRQEFRRQIRQAEAEGVILLARERRARGRALP